eukprot:8677968-Lingulodinium_polyedra.AAC.1
MQDASTGFNGFPDCFKLLQLAQIDATRLKWFGCRVMRLDSNGFHLQLVQLDSFNLLQIASSGLN